MSGMRKRVRELSPADRERYEALAIQFESAWGTAGAEPEIEALLPADGRVRLPLLVHLAKCDLEFRHGRGEVRHVEDYVARFPELMADPAALLDLLICEYGLARGQGAQPNDFARRFPRVAEIFLAAAAELEPPQPWATPPGYTMENDPIGRGGWGMVYKALNQRLGRIEALKVVAPPPGRSSKSLRLQVQRLRQEIPVAARLNHPNIVHLYYDGESNGHPFFAMEYCPGGNLKERLAGGPMAPHQAALLVKTLAVACHHVHFFGPIHRDLKPANVLFGEGDVPKIADFGLALVGEEASTSPLEMVGTPAYMAPEQIDPSLGKVGPATDVYGLGASLYECLTGRPPFSGDSVHNVLIRVRQELPTAPRKLNPRVTLDLEAICLKCLAKVPGQRYESALALADDLGRFLAGAPVFARRHWPVRHAWHWTKTNPVKVSFIIIILLIAAGLFWKIRSDELQQANEEHMARIAAARQGAARGDWVRALPEFDSAILDEWSDSPRLRIERLVGYFALNRNEELTAELEALGRSELGDMAAQVKLIRAAWLLCDTARENEGRALAREACHDRQHLFSDADREFADGLAAEHVGQALKAFERAIKADPLHYLAATSYTVAVATVGDHDEARRQARFLRGVFPHSPIADLAEAIVALVEGKREEMRVSLAAMAEELPPDRRSAVAQMERFFGIFLDLQDIGIKLSANEAPDFLDNINTTRLIFEAKQDVRLPIPALGLYRKRFLDIMSAYVEVGLAVRSGKVEGDMLSRLQALNDDFPDGALLVLTAVLRFSMAIDPLNRGDLKTARAQIEDVANLAARAEHTPSLATQSAVPYLASALGAIADVAMLKLVRDPTPVHLQRAREGVHKLAALRNAWPKLRPPLFGFIIQMTTAPLTSAQAADWSLTEPAGQEAFRKRMNVLATLCRALLDDWAIDEPSNQEINHLRDSLTKWAASSGVLEEEKGKNK
jgi:hypothetical protein